MTSIARSISSMAGFRTRQLSVTAIDDNTTGYYCDFGCHILTGMASPTRRHSMQ
jgi:hypothetical protein